MDDITICSQTYSLNTLHNTFMAWCDNEGSNLKKVERKILKKHLKNYKEKVIMVLFMVIKRVIMLQMVLNHILCLIRSKN